MNFLKILLLFATAAIFAVTVAAISNAGWNWPAVFFGDIAGLDWRAQFNVDFSVHLLLLATWIQWREGSNGRGFVFGFLSMVMGGMFGFPYLAHAIYRGQGDPKRVLLGVHASASEPSALGPGSAAQA